MNHVRQALSVSERRVCRTLGQHRSTQRKVPFDLPDEARLTEDIIALSEEFGRNRLPGNEHVNHKRPSRGLRANRVLRPCRAMVERIWGRGRG